jgi:hypothetical protein
MFERARDAFPRRGDEREMRDQPLSFLQGLFRRYGNLVATRVGPFWSYLVFHPDHIKHVLQENDQNYWKGIIVGRARLARRARVRERARVRVLPAPDLAPDAQQSPLSA